jgi:hypothetical protein
MNKCSLLLALLYLENEIAKQVQSQNAFFNHPICRWEFKAIKRVYFIERWKKDNLGFFSLEQN